ncbi:hypothetical protein A2U01_0050623, partial [Trifolium medium]|nr:hypothetical protein [Trifolium medium]
SAILRRSSGRQLKATVIRLGWLEASNCSRVRKAFQGSKRLWCELVELPKNPMVAGGKIFKRVEGIPRVEEVKVNLLGLRRVV